MDEKALLEALKSGEILAAGLDVYENEPNINPELITTENVVLTPHIASATWEAREKMGEQAVKPCLASVVTMAVAAGADFVLYGPIGDAEYIFPAVSVVDAAYSQLLIEKKIKIGTEHPRYKIS